ncbi:MAG: hypothetical protein K6G26_11680, partial [Lachnospiraceae bacterium]|nr:hypothetical protein [Lachnospiraceae bacterium]
DDEIINNNIALINTISINMEWKYEFYENRSLLFGYDDILYQNTISRAVFGSFSEEDVYFLNGEEIKAITLPLKKYGDTQLEYIAIMSENYKLKEFIEKIYFEDINTIIDNEISASESAEGNGIYVIMPSYHHDYSIDLVNDLKALGIKKIFANYPDLSGITNDHIAISTIKQKADITFSDIGLMTNANPIYYEMKNNLKNTTINRPVLVFNKPYIYIIRDSDTKEVWFVGTVYNP